MANVYRLSRAIRKSQQGAKPLLPRLEPVVAAITAAIMISYESVNRNLERTMKAWHSFTSPRKWQNPCSGSVWNPESRHAGLSEHCLW